MPNTLAHLGVQGLVTRSLIRDADLRWTLLGCVVPDLPWILQRTIRILLPDLVSPYDLRLYAIVQSSLLLSLMGCAAMACFSARPVRVFGILAVNSFLHLVLDACQAKWANGVHLFAPCSWEMLNFGLFWPESLINVTLTLWGLAYVILTWRRRGPGECRVVGSSGRRIIGGMALFVLYLGLPLLMLEGPERADNHFVWTLRTEDHQVGRYIEFDRRPYLRLPEGDLLLTYAGEHLVVDPRSLDRPGTVSVKGRFANRTTLHIQELRIHWPMFRDLSSYIGLTLVALVWCVGLYRDLQVSSTFRSNPSGDSQSSG